MEANQQLPYSSPKIESVEISVEQGFAASQPGMSGDNWTDDGRF